jgi:hypothetical protein
MTAHSRIPSRCLVAALALLAGCDDDALSVPMIDAAVPPPPLPDLSTAPDLTPAIDLIPPFVPLPGDGQFVIDNIMLPMAVTDFSIDLNGDGIPDNQFVHFFRRLKMYGIDLAANLQASILGGFEVFLVDVPPVNKPNRPLAIFEGVPTATPDFSGKGMFLINALQQPTLFSGQRQPTSFEAITPVGAAAPMWSIAISSFNGKGKVVLPFRCVRIRLDIIDAQHAMGVVEGGLRRDDLVSGFVVQVAHLLDDEIHNDPNISKALKTAILALWDNGGANGMSCTNPDGTMGLAGDGHISPCEVLADPGFAQALAPDLALFDANGLRLAQPNNVMPESLSFGLGFTAVPASFH